MQKYAVHVLIVVVMVIVLMTVVIMIMAMRVIMVVMVMRMLMRFVVIVRMRSIFTTHFFDLNFSIKNIFFISITLKSCRLFCWVIMRVLTSTPSMCMLVKELQSDQVYHESHHRNK